MTDDKQRQLYCFIVTQPRVRLLQLLFLHYYWFVASEVIMILFSEHHRPTAGHVEYNVWNQGTFKIGSLGPMILETIFLVALSLRTYFE